MSQVTEEEKNHLVGPIVRGVDGDIAEAVANAIEDDNPDSDVLVDDAAGYVRISVPHYCRITRVSIEEELGRDFPLSYLEPALAGFAGRMKVADDEIIWYLERED